MELDEKALKIRYAANDKKGVANSLNNIGMFYLNHKNYSKALEYYSSAIKIMQQLKDSSGVSYVCNNIATCYKRTSDFNLARSYYQRSLRIQTALDDKSLIGMVNNNLAGLFYDEKNYSQAIKHASISLELGKMIGNPKLIQHAANYLYVSYKAKKEDKKALESYELMIKMRDSLSNAMNKKASIRSQLKYEYEKQAAADSVAHAKESDIKNAEIAKQTAEIRAKKNQQYALFGGLTLVLIFAGFMFNRFKITQKQKIIIEHQKEIVEEQKHLVEEKQKEILDSIQYARRIQMAQIPNEKQVAKSLARLRKL